MDMKAQIIHAIQANGTKHPKSKFDLFDSMPKIWA